MPPSKPNASRYLSQQPSVSTPGKGAQDPLPVRSSALEAFTGHRHSVFGKLSNVHGNAKVSRVALIKNSAAASSLSRSKMPRPTKCHSKQENSAPHEFALPAFPPGVTKAPAMLTPLRRHDSYHRDNAEEEGHAFIYYNMLDPASLDSQASANAVGGSDYLPEPNSISVERALRTTKKPKKR